VFEGFEVVGLVVVGLVVVGLVVVGLVVASSAVVGFAVLSFTVIGTDLGASVVVIVFGFFVVDGALVREEIASVEFTIGGTVVFPVLATVFVLFFAGGATVLLLIC
jgi:hypothetical protein